MGAVSTAYADMPGGDLVAAGLDDLRSGRPASCEALLVAAAGTRLRAAGIPVPAGEAAVEAPHRLYRLLAAHHGDDAHGRYLALLRQVESFARAAEHAARG